MSIPKIHPGSNHVQTQATRKGVIAVMVALLFPVILIITGFAVDLAHMQRSRTELRAVADLAAKAAAGALSRTQDLDAAKTAAKQVALQNSVAGEPLNLADADIELGHSDRQPNGEYLFSPGGTPLNAVRVNAQRTEQSNDGPVGLYFGLLYGRPFFEPALSSTASFLDVDVCLVLDRSSSMKLQTSSSAGYMSTSNSRFCDTPRSDSRWVALENSVALFVTELTSTLAVEHVAVVTFASNYTSSCGETNLDASIDQTLSGNLSLVNAAMAARSDSVWNGGTYINEGVSLGRQVLTGPSSRTYARKVMIVLTDGVSSSGAGDPVVEASTAVAQDIRVHTITFSAAAGQEPMQQVAAAGNGNHYHAPDSMTLDDVFRQIAGSVAVLTQ